MKRIMKELSLIINSPHPNITLYPCREDVTFWKVLLLGPEGTPYESGFYILYL